MSRYTRTSRLLVLLLCALLLAGMLPSFGALGATTNTGKGKVTVSLKTDVSQLPANAEVEFTLYKIGEAAPQTAAGWKFDAPFQEYGAKIIAAKNETSLQTAVNALAGEIVKNKDYKGTAKALSGGSAEFTGLANGIYIGVLTKAPEGLSANASLLTIPSWNADKTNLRYELDVNVKDSYTGNLTISKSVVSPYAADHSATYGFTVTLTEGGKTKDIDGDYKTTAGATVTFRDGVAWVGVQGGESVTITGLPFGIGYTVTESSANDLTPASTGASGTIGSGSTVAYTNTRDTGMRYVHNGVTVNKVDEAGQPLGRATFTLYLDENLTVPVATYSGSRFQIRTDDPELASYLPTAEEGSRTFYLVETIAPTGYQPDSTSRKVVVTTSVDSGIEDGKYMTVTTYSIQIEGQAAATVVNVPSTGVERTDGTVTVTKTDGSDTISGAEFTLYDENREVTKYTGGQFEISTADEALKDILPAAGDTRTLTLKETGVPVGYTGSDAEYRVEITARENTRWNDNHTMLVTTTYYGITIDGEKSATVVNTPIPGVERTDDTVTVTKTDGKTDGSALIYGAEFTLYDGNKKVTSFSGGKFEISTANEKLQNYLPEAGQTRTLTLKETGVPKGYTGSDIEYPVRITADKQTAWNKDHTKLVATTIYTISIDGSQKLEVPNKPITGSGVAYSSVIVKKVTVNTEENEKQPLKGAVFTLYSGDTEIATYGGDAVDSFFISTKDKALAKYLPAIGKSVTLTLKETKAPDGYVLASDEYDVVLKTNVVEEWNNDHTKLITWTVYDITIGDKSESYLEVVNEPETPPPTPPEPPSEPPVEPPAEPPAGGGDEPEPPAPTAAPTVDISGTKVWVDKSNQPGLRPGSITVELLVGGTVIDSQTVSGEGNNWDFTFRGLPKYDSSGHEIAYTVREVIDKNESWTERYKDPQVKSAGENSWTITNEYVPPEPEYIDLSGQKVWDHKNNDRENWPTSIKLVLYRDNEKYDSRTVTPGTNWEFTFQHLPVDDGYGHKYDYSVREDKSDDEDNPSHYLFQLSEADDKLIVTNTYMPNIGGSTPPTPTDDDETTSTDDGTPPPTGTVPNVPQRPEDIPDRNTGTPVPHFEEMGDEELEETFDIFGYSTPLYGMFGTGDQIPVWVWICGGIGILALVIAIVMGRKKKTR